MFSSSAAHTKIAFIGLGNMGLPMAKNLVLAGYQLKAYDVDEKPLEELEALGAEVAESANDAVPEADIIITMLPGDKHVEKVYHGSDGDTGILDASRLGSLMIDCSTISPTTSQEIAEAAAERGRNHIDAPVSGGTVGAAAGSLAIMCGASQEAFDLAKPVLDVIGGNIVHCAGAGTGGAAKLCNNLLLGITMTGVCEAFALGQKLGIDPKVLNGVVNSATGSCWVTTSYHPVPGVIENTPASRDYEGGFGSHLMLKDLGLAMDAARQVGQPVPMGSTAQSLYALLCSQGNARKDFGSMMNMVGPEEED